MAANKSKFLQWIDFRVRVTITDGRMLVGTFMAFDKHLNLVLSETEEFRTVKPKKQGDAEKQIKRALGMVILRGENIVSITAEAPPNIPAKKNEQGVQKTQIQKVGQNTQFGNVPIQNIITDPLKGVGQPQMIPNLGMPPSLSQQTPGNIPQNLMQQNQNFPRPPQNPPI